MEETKEHLVDRAVKDIMHSNKYYTRWEDNKFKIFAEEIPDCVDTASGHTLKDCTIVHSMKKDYANKREVRGEPMIRMWSVSITGARWSMALQKEILNKIAIKTDTRFDGETYDSSGERV